MQKTIPGERRTVGTHRLSKVYRASLPRQVITLTPPDSPFQHAHNRTHHSYTHIHSRLPLLARHGRQDVITPPRKIHKSSHNRKESTRTSRKALQLGTRSSERLAHPQLPKLSRTFKTIFFSDNNKGRINHRFRVRHSPIYQTPPHPTPPIDLGCAQETLRV